MGSLQEALLKVFPNLEQQQTPKRLHAPAQQKEIAPIAKPKKATLTSTTADDKNQSFRQVMATQGVFPAKRKDGKGKAPDATKTRSAAPASLSQPSLPPSSVRQAAASKASISTNSHTQQPPQRAAATAKESSQHRQTSPSPKKLPCHPQKPANSAPAIIRSTNPKNQQKPTQPQVLPIPSRLLEVPTGMIEPGIWMQQNVIWQGYQIPDNAGIDEQVAEETRTTNEVVIGLDFGTAYTKVVIGDQAQNTAYAVPFSSQMAGINAYLLPCKVWIDDGCYSLTERGIARQRLKLNLLGAAEDSEAYFDAVAYLALVIRHSRGWLFAQYHDIYKTIEVVWSLSLGLPAADYNARGVVKKFKHVAEKAWRIASSPHNKITVELIKSICTNSNSEVDCEFDIIPELSAQIFGFLKSTRFDPNGKNLFFIIDIGAGTVDSSIFHVLRDSKKSWTFTFYANYVGHNGTINLHDGRILFIIDELKKLNIYENNKLIIDMAKNNTESLHGIPDKIHEYFQGIKYKYDYDNDFYKNRYAKQIMQNTLKEAKNYIDKYKLKGSTLFLCGGGSRMSIYKKITLDLYNHQNASWLHFIQHDIEVPEILRAPGVKKSDFDRLAVAFGLSFHDVGNYVRAGLYEHQPVNLTGILQRCPQCGQPTKNCWCD